MRNDFKWIAIVASGLLAVASQAQQSGEQVAENLLKQQRTIDDKLAEQRRAQTPIESMVDLQWGGWLEHYSFHFDDGVQSSRWFHRPAAVLWSRMTIDDGTHEFFVRGRLTYDYFKAGDEYTRQQDWRGPNLDRGWYKIDVGRAFALTTPSDPWGLSVKLGRQEVVWGSGFIFDRTIDGVLLDADIYDFQVRGLIAQDIASTSNIDYSSPVNTHSDRCFFGLEIAYDGIDRHRPYAFVLWNNDSTDERPKDYFQNYSYDTNYFGVGCKGELTHNLSYWAEAAFENGESYGDARVFKQDTVNAWGANIGIEYLFDGEMKPRVACEYIFASGDGDRVGSPTNAAGGNERGADTSFNAFGFRDTGISASPIPSNIHIWRAGGSIKPLPAEECFKDLEIGTNWFLYHKNQRAGAISDWTATNGSGYVGWEMDYYINWRIMSDVSWTARWGAFFPGRAYDDRSTRHFVFSGVTWSF